MEPMLNLKRDRSTDVTQCIICQEKKSDKLLCAAEQGLTKLKESVQIRQKHRDCQNRIARDRLVLILTTNPDSLVWHKSCYASFTSKTNISRLQNRNYSESCEAGTNASAGDLPSRPGVLNLLMIPDPQWIAQHGPIPPSLDCQNHHHHQSY